MLDIMQLQRQIYIKALRKDDKNAFIVPKMSKISLSKINLTYCKKRIKEYNCDLFPLQQGLKHFLAVL